MRVRTILKKSSPRKDAAIYNCIVSNQDHGLSRYIQCACGVPLFISHPNHIHDTDPPLHPPDTSAHTAALLIFIFNSSYNTQDQLFQLITMIEQVSEYSHITLICPNLPYSHTDDATYHFLQASFSPWPVTRLIVCGKKIERPYIHADHYHTIPMPNHSMSTNGNITQDMYDDILQAANAFDGK